MSDHELAGYLMYPKVFTEFAEHQRRFGDVSVLPTPVFLHGLTRDEELFVNIERGKTLVIRFLAVGEADEEGRRTDLLRAQRAAAGGQGRRPRGRADRARARGWPTRATPPTCRRRCPA